LDEQRHLLAKEGAWLVEGVENDELAQGKVIPEFRQRPQHQRKARGKEDHRLARERAHYQQYPRQDVPGAASQRALLLWQGFPKTICIH
jgi:hypothetical protein